MDGNQGEGQIVGYQINETAVAFYRGRPGVRPSDLCERAVVYATPEAAVAAFARGKVTEATQAILDYRTSLTACGRTEELAKMDELEAAIRSQPQ